jgi:hypothetical protein
MPRSRLEEVEWGEEREGAVLRRWVKASPLCIRADRIIRSRPTQDFDYVVFDDKGLPIAYVEIKVRRIAFGDFGDAVAPIRKHEYAEKLWRRHRFPMLMIVAYACGTLVQVNLHEPPAQRRDIKRRDRPNAVPHGIWKHDQVKVVWEAPSEEAA